MATSAIQKIRSNSSLRNQIGESLSAAIISGELPSGTLVSVPSLAAQFAVSGTPVREAMLDLEQRGFVTSVRNKGFRVTAVSEGDLREIVEARQYLEGSAMAALASDLSGQNLDQWRTLANVVEQCARVGDLAGFIEADRDFHMGLLSLRGNKRLARMVGELRAQTRMVNLAEMTHSHELAESAREHFMMLDLLAAGDSGGVRALMEKHLGHIILWWSAPATG